MSYMPCIVENKFGKLSQQNARYCSFTICKIYQTEYSYLFQSTRDHHQRIKPNNTT